PSYIPATAPASPQPGVLATTIVSGGGTNSMIVANAASSTALTQTVVHNNTPNLLAAWNACLAAGGGDVVLPVTGSSSLFFYFRSVTALPAASNPANRTCHLKVSQASATEPLVLPFSSSIDGFAQVSTSFQYSPLGWWASSGFPAIIVNRRSNGGI